VVLDHESFRSRFIFIQCATGKVEDTAADTAMEVMVMSLSRALVQCTENRMVDLSEPPALDQEFQITVNRRLV